MEWDVVIACSIFFADTTSVAIAPNCRLRQSAQLTGRDSAYKGGLVPGSATDMPRIESIKSAVLNIFKSGHCGGRTGTRRSDHLRQRSPHRKISITRACVTFVRCKDSAAANVAASKEPFTHIEVREVAEWLVEAIARGDLQTATYALKACLVVPWPRGISVSLCQEVLNRLFNADRLDWDRPLADFYRITAGYSNREQTELAADVVFAGQWLLDRYRHLTGRDPLLAHPAHRQNPVHGQCRAVLDKAGETFTEIRTHLIEQRRQKMSTTTSKGANAWERRRRSTRIQLINRTSRETANVSEHSPSPWSG